MKPHYLQCLYAAAMCINVRLTRYIISETYTVSAVNVIVTLLLFDLRLFLTTVFANANALVVGRVGDTTRQQPTY